MVGILEILGEHEVADVQQGGQLGHRKVPHPPGVLELVGEASVQDEAPPGCCGLVNRAQRLNEEREGAVHGNHLDDALPRPRGELGAKGDLGRLVPFPAGVIRAPGGTEGKTGFGHGDTRNDRAGRGVEGAEAFVPGGGGVVDRHDIASRSLQ